MLVPLEILGAPRASHDDRKQCSNILYLVSCLFSDLWPEQVTGLSQNSMWLQGGELGQTLSPTISDLRSEVSPMVEENCSSPSLAFTLRPVPQGKV